MEEMQLEEGHENRLLSHVQVTIQNRYKHVCLSMQPRSTLRLEYISEFDNIQMLFLVTHCSNLAYRIQYLEVKAHLCLQA